MMRIEFACSGCVELWSVIAIKDFPRRLTIYFIFRHDVVDDHESHLEDDGSDRLFSVS